MTKTPRKQLDYQRRWKGLKQFSQENTEIESEEPVDLAVHDWMHAQPETPFEAMSRLDLERAFEQVLKTLTPREMQVLLQRFGMDQSLAEVGESEGVTGQRIRQLEAKALRKLRHPARSNRIESAAFGKLPLFWIHAKSPPEEEDLQRILADQERRESIRREEEEEEEEEEKRKEHVAAVAAVPESQHSRFKNALAEEKKRQEERKHSGGREARMLAAREQLDAEIEIQASQKNGILDSLIDEAAEAAREGDTAWLEFIDELEPHELELMNERVDYVRSILSKMGLRLELRMP